MQYGCCLLPSPEPPQEASHKSRPRALKGLITLVGSKSAVNSHRGMVGEAPLKRMEGGKRKGKRANKMEEVAPGMAVLSLK